MNLFKTKLEAALALRLSLVLLLAMVVLGSFSVFFIRSLGDYSIEVNEANIRENTTSYFLSAVTEEAEKYSTAFNQTAVFVKNLAGMARNYETNLDAYGKENANSNEKLIFHPKQKIYSNSATAEVMVLFGIPYKGANLTPEAKREINALSHLDLWLIEFKNNFPYFIAAYVETETDIMRYYPNIHIVESIPPDYSIQKELYYWIAAPKNNPDKKVCWTDIYMDVTGLEMVTVSAPFFLNGEFHGVAGMDIDMTAFLKKFDPKPHGEALEKSFSALIQKNGGIAGLWNRNMDILGLDVEKAKDVEYFHRLPRALTKSKLSDVIELQSAINASGSGTQQLTLADGESYLCAFAEIPVNGWTLLTFVPEKDIFSPIAKTRAKTRGVTRELIAYCLVLIVLIGSGAYWMIARFLRRRVHAPIQTLTHAMRDVAESRSRSELKQAYPDEIGRLTEHFNRMSADIATYRDEMERLVGDRTQELRLANDELDKARLEAEKASVSKSMFIGKMSHELRTPLNAILGYSQIIESVVEDHELKRKAAAIGVSGRHLLDLINNILDLSKMEADRIVLAAEPVDIRTLCFEIKYVFQNQVDEKNLDFMLDIDDDVPTVVSLDPLRFRQLLINIVGNAVKYTNEGHVKLSVSVGGGNDERVDLVVRIADTGTGMKKEFLDNLFTPFSQENHRIEGAGLGLTISRHIVRKMGGDIDVESIADRGSVFTVRLPGLERLGDDETQSVLIEPTVDVPAPTPETTTPLGDDDLSAMFERWREVSESSVFEDIASFAKDVGEYAMRGGHAPLRDWSEEIIRIASTYDLKKMRKQLRLFESLINND